MSEGGEKTDFLKMGKEHCLFLCSVLLYLLRFIRLPNYGVDNIFDSLVVRIVEP